MSERFSSGMQNLKQTNKQRTPNLQTNKQKVSHARRIKKTDCVNLFDEATKIEVLNDEDPPLLKSRDAEHGSVCSTC